MNNADQDAGAFSGPQKWANLSRAKRQLIVRMSASRLRGGSELAIWEMV